MPRKISVLLLSFAVLLCLAPLVRADFSTPSKNLSNSPSYQSKYPKVRWLEGGAGSVFVIWVETDGTNDYLYFSKSTDGGTTWSTPFQLTTQGQILRQLDLYDDYTYSFVVSDPYIHVVMQWRENSTDDYDIWYIRGADLGDTWDIINDWKPLTNNDDESRYPDIDANGSYVHVTYQDEWPGDYDIMYKRITDSGAGIVDQTRRLTFSGSDAYWPRIAVSSSGYTVNIVYQDTDGQHWNIFYKHIDDMGSGPYSTRQLTSSAYYNARPDIAVGTDTYDGMVYIVYESDWPGNLDIMYKRLTLWGHSSGTTYTARLTYSTTESRSACVDFNSALNYNVHISYDDDWPGNKDIMYRGLTNGGGAGFISQRVSWGTGDSVSSTLASHGNWAYIVWSDNTSGNYEIYIKNGYAN